jgi:hypothetical protein
VREFIPGYTDSSVKRDVSKLVFQTDSLEKALYEKDAYYRNILNLLTDRTDNRDTVILEVSAGKK